MKIWGLRVCHQGKNGNIDNIQSKTNRERTSCQKQKRLQIQIYHAIFRDHALDCVIFNQ